MNTQELKNKAKKYCELAEKSEDSGRVRDAINMLLSAIVVDNRIIETLESELATLRAELAWHPYPAEKPTEDGWHDVIYHWGSDDSLGYSRKDISQTEFMWNDVIAFRKRPAPYQGEK